MTKKILLTFFFMSFLFVANAQDYKVVSVEALPLDMSARKHIKTDDNGQQCALLRIATQNIAPEKKEGFHFSSDYGSQVVAHSIIEGEIWVWVSPGLKTLKIAHSDWGKYELHITKYVPQIESLTTYKIVIEGLVVESETGALTISSVPSGAELILNGQPVGPTPYTANLPLGKYTFVLKKESHLDYSGEVILDSEVKGITAQLTPICGRLVITTEPEGAYVQIDGSQYETTPFIMDSILVGSHQLRIEMKGYESEILPFQITENQIFSKNFVLHAMVLEDTYEDEIEIYNDEQIGTSQLLTNKMIRTVPSMNHQMNDVLALIPQSVTTSNSLAAGGGNYRQSNFTIDGAVFNNVFGIGGNLPGGTGPSLEQIRSLTFDIAPYDVRQNDFIGASINAITKSGTNELHASVYDYFQNSSLYGTEFGVKDKYGDYPEPLRMSETFDNTIGLSIGGPVIKDKFFYYLNFEYMTDIDPAQSRFARPTEDEDWGSSTHFNRPTESQMDLIRNHLISRYGYDPGRYEGYTASTPDYKLLARVDWNLNPNNTFTLSYNRITNSYSTSPSNSITPFPSSLYNRNSYGRTSDCALYFESCRYLQGQNFSSIVGQLKSKSKSGKINNLFRVTYSHQDEPRGSSSGDFPTVDILENVDTDGDGEPETRAVYTTFGPDPFSTGNLRAAKVLNINEELGLSLGNNELLAGLQFEHNHLENGYLQGGNGFYVYESWNDFYVGNNPLAFAYTYGNNESRVYETPWMNQILASIYIQDEIKFGKRFKMSVGLRAEMPYYPSITDRNYNKEFSEGWNDEEGYHHSIADGEGNTMYGMSTADVPSMKIMLLPRFAFSLGFDDNNNYVIRGSSGLYSGRIPSVWFISAIGNSNCNANQYIDSSNPSIGFYTSETELINNNLGLFSIGDLPTPQSTTILDKGLKMPEIWKTSIAFDAKLPGEFIGMLNFVYGKEINSVSITKLGIIEGSPILLPGEPEARTYWTNENVVNSLGRSVTPYYLTNSQNKGYSMFITAQLQKQVGSKLNFLASYTYGIGKSSNDGIGDQVISAYSTNTYGVNGSNVGELGYVSYISPNRLLLYAGYTFRTGKHHSNTFGIYYEGRNLAYIGNYSYCRYSYTMTTNINGDGGANSLVYIPTDSELNNMPFSDEGNKAAFGEFLRTDKYLSTHRGQYAERGGAIAPFFNTINLHYTHDFILKANSHKIQVGLDLKNVANLIYRGWGNMQRLSSEAILRLSGNGSEASPYTYTFTNPSWDVYASTYSTWALSLTARYSF